MAALLTLLLGALMAGTFQANRPVRGVCVAASDVDYRAKLPQGHGGTLREHVTGGVMPSGSWDPEIRRCECDYFEVYSADGGFGPWREVWTKAPNPALVFAILASDGVYDYCDHTATVIRYGSIEPRLANCDCGADKAPRSESRIGYALRWVQYGLGRLGFDVY